MDVRQPVEINTQRVPVGNSIGAAVLIVILLAMLLFSLPGLRPTAFWGSSIGIVLGVSLIVWRRRRVGRPPHPTLGITRT
ncbi:MAG TPA: hypothetical protein VJ717_00550 [Gemmatimonadaceae bacterium]|nr:hypothetical protein [Gemmatimonadaceae bacterium]